jgi:hypothetical protein
MLKVVSLAALVCLLTPAAASGQPPPPDDVQAYQQGATVRISWSPVADADQYRIYRGTTLIGSTSTTTFIDSIVDAGPLYYVTAVAGGVESQPSDPAVLSAQSCIVISPGAWPPVWVNVEECNPGTGQVRPGALYPR